MKYGFFKIFLPLALFSAISLCGCSKSESYSNLLRDEERAVNWYLSGQNVSVDIPADSILLYGNNAPFYKLDEDGLVYLKVLQPGDMTPQNRPQKGDKVYFRFDRQNLRVLQQSGSASWEGNSSDLSLAATSFIFGNTSLPSSVELGEGVQSALKFVGYNSRVMVIIKASKGPTDEQSSCMPYLYDIRYFKALY